MFSMINLMTIKVLEEACMNPINKDPLLVGPFQSSKIDLILGKCFFCIKRTLARTHKHTAATLLLLVLHGKHSILTEWHGRKGPSLYNTKSSMIESTSSSSLGDKSRSLSNGVALFFPWPSWSSAVPFVVVVVLTDCGEKMSMVE
jgi:hypothetical protein